MIDKAIAKITEEMMAIGDPFAQFIEEHLTQKCSNDIVAAKLLSEGKSLKFIHDQIVSDARKIAKNGQTHIPDEELYQRIDEYYGITPEAIKGKAVAETVNILDLL